MADYVYPRVLVQQEFEQAAVFSNRPLAAVIVGPQHKLFRYTEAAEKALIGLGNYVSGVNTAYAYPAKPANSVVDQNYVKVYIEEAVAKYFPLPSDVISQGSFTNAATKVTGSTNKIQTGAASFDATVSLTLATANGYSRSAPLSNRDVKAGDVVVITKADGTDALTTKVKKLVATPTTYVAPTEIGNALNSAATANVPALVFTGTTNAGVDQQTPTTTGHVTYVGYLSKGIVNDVYTITCTTAGTVTTNGTARFSISSANGAFTTKTGLTCTTTTSPSGRLIVDDAGGNNLAVVFDGDPNLATTDKWTWTVATAVLTGNASITDCPSLTVSGTPTGTTDITYIVKVEQGGVFYTGSNADVCAKVSITSNDVDSSANVNVRLNIDFNLGTRGLLAKFGAAVSNGGLVKGDIYYVPVVPVKDGRVNIIELQDNLSSALAAEGDAALRYTLHLSEPVTILNKVRDVESGVLNWATSADALTVNSAAVITNNLVVSTADTRPLAKLPVLSAKVFVHYRALLLENTTAVGSIGFATDVAAKLGTIHPDNALAEGVYDAALNSSGVPVYFIGVATDNLAGYNTALAAIKRHEANYAVVPMTFDRSVQDAVIAHVNASSAPGVGKWKKAWTSTEDVASKLLKEKDASGANFLAHTAADKLTVTFTNTGANAINLLTSGIRPTDTLLVNFLTLPDGTVGYTEVAISEVVSETTLVLASALTSVISSGSPVKAQIKRYYTLDERVANLALVGSDFNNRRVNPVFPDTAKTGSVVKNGYFVAAALAGARSGTVPHQGLTNSQLLGFDDVSKSLITYTEEQLNVLATAGYWIVTQNAVGATPYTRHQLTSDSSNLNMSEDSITTNVDSISYGIKEAMAPFIGVYNINQGTLGLIGKAIRDELNYRMVNTGTARAGNQLLGYEVKKLAQNATFKDKVDIEIQLEVPYPVNFITVKLTV